MRHAPVTLYTKEKPHLLLKGGVWLIRALTRDTYTRMNLREIKEHWHFLVPPSDIDIWYSNSEKKGK